ncbi:MAG: class I SAM-dependent methyltransferase [Halalkalicoccus sp.]
MNPNDVHREWAARSGEFSPTYYAHRGPDEASERIGDAIDSLAGSEPAILELGCSSGRHLALLADRGYEDLSGIELNPDALGVMKEHYPDLAAVGTFHLDAIESALGKFEKDRFDVIYSVETLQHVHPENEWVFDEIARTTNDFLITVENESDDPGSVNYVNDEFPLFYRDWQRVFRDRGFTHVRSTELKRDTFRLFRLD